MTDANTSVDQPNVLKAVIYARVSTDDSDQSVQNQLPLCRDYCARNGWKVVGEYFEDYTGSTINRPRFLEMLGRLELRDVSYVVAYDQSRLTRCKTTDGNFDRVREIINKKGATIRFVATDVDPNSEAGEILTKFNDIANSRYNVELSRKTSSAMQRKKAEEHKHMGRPARFMFTEDIEGAPEGRYRKPDPDNGIKGTFTVPEDYVMSFARDGISIHKAAKLMGISPNTLIAEMKPREAQAHKRLKSVAVAKIDDWNYVVSDTDYVFYTRCKGTKDRYSTYMTLYEDAIKRRKGSTSERVGNDPENTSERGDNE